MNQITNLSKIVIFITFSKENNESYIRNKILLSKDSEEEIKENNNKEQQNWSIIQEYDNNIQMFRHKDQDTSNQFSNENLNNREYNNIHTGNRYSVDFKDQIFSGSQLKIEDLYILNNSSKDLLEKELDAKEIKEDSSKINQLINDSEAWLITHQEEKDNINGHIAEAVHILRQESSEKSQKINALLDTLDNRRNEMIIHFSPQKVMLNNTFKMVYF